MKKILGLAIIAAIVIGVITLYAHIVITEGWLPVLFLFVLAAIGTGIIRLLIYLFD